MNRSHELQFIIRNTGRFLSDASDDGELVRSCLDVAVWNAASSVPQSRKITIGQETCDITLDWVPLVKWYERELAANKYILAGGRSDIGRRISKARFPRRPVKITISVRANPRSNPRATINRAVSVVESSLYDVFVIMNLSAPGSCNFYRCYLIADEKKEGDVSLSSHLFEASFLDRDKVGWPKIQVLPVERVVKWFDAIRNGASQLPEMAAERAVFALFYLSKGNSDPTDVIWIFYALEGLLQTRVGESFSLMVKRLSLLLGMDSGAVKILKKELRALYNMRSAIVHGGFEVMHPLNDDGLDERAATTFGDILERLNYGGALVLAVLQKMIENNWIEIQFDEVLSGISPPT